VEDVDGAMGDLSEAATGLDGILATPPPRVYVDELDGDGVVLRVQYWIEDPYRRDIHEIRSAYAREIRTRLGEAGVDVESTSRM
jgi:small-conductance mechanosensitive channel